MSPLVQKSALHVIWGSIHLARRFAVESLPIPLEKMRIATAHAVRAAACRHFA